MAQKILAGRCADPMLGGDTVEVKVDQVVLARAPMRALAEGLHAGLKTTHVEVAVAYDGHAVTAGHGGAAENEGAEAHATPAVLSHGILLARAGVGYPAPVHLERFASPARLCVTDEPRLAGTGGAGMLTLVVPPGQIGQALAQGTILVRPPRSIQVLLTGRTRPFVCARDVAMELLRRGLGDAVRRVEAERAAPVVLEFAGPSARLLSVGERAVLASVAPQLGAAAAVFVSDERTEVFLRDQRRSKAHRALVPDAGAPCDEVFNVDLGAIDPLLMDDAGVVRPVRDLAGKPVSQVLLGGDSGTTLRDMFAAAALLKSKRVPPKVELLVAVPSRQMLEVLAQAGALADLIATGARLVEPDARVMTGALYAPPAHGLGARACDPEPRPNGAPAPGVIVASAETLAYAVATGEVGDPRSFKRPVRVTVPRTLPTDDVLIVRERKGADAALAKAAPPAPAPAQPYRGGALEVVDGPPVAVHGQGDLAVVCATLDEVRALAARASELAPRVRAVMAPFIPSGTVALFSGVGIAALQVEAPLPKGAKGPRTLALPPVGGWAEKGATSVAFGGAKLPLTWLALGVERVWASAGTARPKRS